MVPQVGWIPPRNCLFDLLKIVGVLVVLAFLDLHLFLFTVASTPVVILISLLFRRNAQRAYRAVRGRLALQNAYTAEIIGGVRATRAFGRDRRLPITDPFDRQITIGCGAFLE